MTYVLVLMAHMASYNDATAITAIPGYADNQSCDQAEGVGRHTGEESAPLHSRTSAASGESLTRS